MSVFTKYSFTESCSFWYISFSFSSMQPKSMLQWSEFLMPQTTKMKTNIGITLIFEQLWHVFFGFGSFFVSILVNVDLFSCQNRRAMTCHQIGCIPWMWDRNCSDPTSMKGPVHHFVIEEDSWITSRPYRKAPIKDVSKT